MKWRQPMLPDEVLKNGSLLGREPYDGSSVHSWINLSDPLAALKITIDILYKRNTAGDSQ